MSEVTLFTSYNIQIQPGLKAKLWLIILVNKNKIKSCNAKRGGQMKMASRSIDLISKKTNCTCSTLYFLISKTTKFARATRFSSALPLFCTTTTLFCRTKRQTSQLHIIFMEEFLPNILSPVLMFAFIFHCRSFSPCLPLVFLIVSQPL